MPTFPVPILSPPAITFPMKLLSLLLTLGLALSAPAFAGNKAAKKEGKAGKKEVGAAVRAADKNGNGTIDADEVASLAETISKAGPDSELKTLDKDGDGKLNDDEVKAINAKLAAHAGKKKNK